MSQNHFKISKLQIMKSLILSGYFGLIFRELRHRLYSDRYFLLLSRKISLPDNIPEPEIHVTLRPMKPDDIPKLLDINQKGMKEEDVLERIRLLQILNSGIQECYVAETDQGVPCHISWWINSSQNPIIKEFYGGRILPLGANEVMFEGVFTLEAYQRLGILKWRRLKFFEKSLGAGATRLIVYVQHDNLPSLKTCRSAGYKLFMIRKDQWRIFRRTFIFKVVPEDTPYPLENKKIADIINKPLQGFLA
jgi:hypothetical protein